MAETSLPWDGTTTGDATTAPYDAATEWAKLMAIVQGSWADANKGLVVVGLAPSVNGGNVRIAVGDALVYGTQYSNVAANVDIPIPTPATSTRIDAVVLRKSWAGQTIRITRIAGTEGAGAPSLTQNAGVTWDYPLCNASITTGGAITITDLRSLKISEVHSHGGDASGGTIAHTSLGSVTADQHHAQIHASAHHSGGGDVMAHQSISGAGSNTHATIDTHLASGGSHADPHITGISQITTGSITLPTVTGNNGLIRFYKALGGTLTINRNGAESLYGPGGTGLVASFVLQAGESVTMYCDGSQWAVY